MNGANGRKIRTAVLGLPDHAAQCHLWPVWGSCAAAKPNLASVRRGPKPDKPDCEGNGSFVRVGGFKYKRIGSDDAAIFGGSEGSFILDEFG